jgi:hypothetical protein
MFNRLMGGDQHHKWFVSRERPVDQRPEPPHNPNDPSNKIATGILVGGLSLIVAGICFSQWNAKKPHEITCAPVKPDTDAMGKMEKRDLGKVLLMIDPSRKPQLLYGGLMIKNIDPQIKGLIGLDSNTAAKLASAYTADISDKTIFYDGQYFSCRVGPR